MQPEEESSNALWAGWLDRMGHQGAVGWPGYKIRYFVASY